ncbi:MAG: fimbrillin family protein, partial [Mucinivorans sp.]
PWANTDADWYMGSTSTNPDNTYVQVTKSPNGGDGVWRYSPIKLWPKEANVSFFAFSPVPVTGGESYGITDVKVTTGSPTMKFEVKADIKSQVDLLRAEALNKFEEEVQLDFKHALTRVSFAAKANVTAKQMVRLDKIELVGIKNKGTLKLYDDARTIGANNDLGGWTTEAGVVAYVPALSHEVVGIVPETLTAMTQDDQAMFMIPQQFTKGGAAKLKVEYSFSNDGGKKWVNNSKFEIDLGDYTEYWNPSKNYRYVLTLSPANVYSFSASIVDWDSEISVSVKDALSITKLDAAREATTTTPYEFTVTTGSSQWKGYKLTSDQPWVKITDKADGTGAALTKEYSDAGVTKAGY